MGALELQQLEERTPVGNCPRRYLLSPSPNLLGYQRR